MTSTPPAFAGLPDQQTPLYLHILVTAAVVLPCIVVSQFTAHWEAATIDDHLYAFCGLRIWQGATLYVDVWDHKPPGVHWINALGFAVTGGRYAGIIGLCALAVTAGYALFFTVAASVYHRGTAAIATMLAGLYMTHGWFFGGSNRGETFLVPCELAAIAVYIAGCKRDRAAWWYVVGLCGGAALLFKQTGFAALGAAAIHTVILCLVRDLSPRAARRRAALAIGGLATVALAAAAALAAQGTLGEAWYAVFSFNCLFLAGDAGHWLDAWWWSNWIDRYVLALLELPLLMALIAVVYAALRRWRPDEQPSDARGAPHATHVPRFMTLFGLWYALALVGAVVSPASMRHHFLPTLPPLLLLGAYLINVLKTEVQLVRRLAQRAWVLVAFVLVATFAADAAYLQFQKTSKVYWDRKPRIENGRWTYNRTPAEAVGDEIARITRPDDTVQCWDYTPAVYLHARRPNACRVLTATFATRLPANSTPISREFHETLLSRPPKVIVIQAVSYQDLPEHESPTRPGTLITRRWLDAHYRRAEALTHGSLYVLLRTDPEPDPTP